jgi:multidrug resistance efflux pump
VISFHKKSQEPAQPEKAFKQADAGPHERAASPVKRQIDKIDHALMSWRTDREKNDNLKRTASTQEGPRFFVDKLKSPVIFRSALALAAVVALGLKPVERLLATTSAEATVNAQLITIRAPIDGYIATSAHSLEIGEQFQSGDEIVAIKNPRADRTPLNKLQRERTQLIATIRAYEDKMSVLAARRAQVDSQKAHFADARTHQVEHKKAEIDAQIDGAKAENEAATVALKRARFLFDRKDIAAVDLEKAERNRRLAEGALRGLLSRNQGIDVELSALRQGLFVGDSYNDTPQSAQRGLDLVLDIAELNAKLEGMQAELASLSEEIESERLRYDDISVASLRSPASGRVWEVLTAPGEIVRAGQDLVRLLDCHAAIVTASVGETAYQKLRLGQSANFPALCSCYHQP